jgi:hypothetical protein
MKTFHKIAGVVLTLLLIAAAYGTFETRTTMPPLPSNSAATESNGKAAQMQLVDQTPLKIAQQLAPLATLPGERDLAKESIRLTDHEVDIAFTAALRDATLHPPALTAEAR